MWTENSYEFGKPFEELSWKHRTPTPHRSEANGIAERAVRRIEEGTSAVLLEILAWMKSEWLSPWSVTAICEMSKTSWQTGNALGKDDVENHSFKGPVFPFDSIVEYHPLSAIWWENVTRNIAWICTVCGENLERRLSKCRPWGAVKNWTLRSPRSKTQCKGNDNVQNWWKNIFPIADCTAKLLGRDHEVQQATPRQYHPVGSEDLLRRFSGKRGWVSANITTWWRWSPKRLLVDRWRLHSSSSHRTLSSSPRAERRIISNFTKVFWRDQDNSHKSGGVARKTCQRLLECWWNPVRVMDRTREAHVVDGEASSRICVFRGALDKDSSNCQTSMFVAWDLDWHVESSHYRKSKNGLWRNQRSTTLDNWEASAILILKMKSLKRPWTCKKQVGRSHGRCCALQTKDTRHRAWKLRETAASENTNPRKKPTHACTLWKLMNPQGDVLNLHFREITRITSPRKGWIHRLITI